MTDNRSDHTFILKCTFSDINRLFALFFPRLTDYWWCSIIIIMHFILLKYSKTLYRVKSSKSGTKNSVIRFKMCIFVRDSKVGRSVQPGERAPEGGGSFGSSVTPCSLTSGSDTVCAGPSCVLVPARINAPTCLSARQRLTCSSCCRQSEQHQPSSAAF